MINPHHEKNLKEITRLNRIIGQLNGLKRKIEVGEHCRDIVHLLRSARKALDALETKLVEYHIEQRVHDLREENISRREENEITEELIKIFSKKSF